ncbi:MAG: hypothetical protein FWG79_08475 [Bacteroidales bacterium]|nr:hypothetical protein [Bacteroidales bacterium]
MKKFLLLFTILLAFQLNVVDLAIQGNANYLVSGDKKVLETPIESDVLELTTLAAFKEKIEQ